MAVIDDFINYYTSLGGKRVLRDCQGETAESIALFVSLVPFPLPELYLGYLRHFGTNDGLLRLAGDGATKLDRLIEFWRLHLGGYSSIPPHCATIALSGLTGHLALCYANAPIDKPSVVVHWDDGIDLTKSSSFTNYLYSRAFCAAADDPRVHDVTLYSDDPRSRPQLVQVVLDAGFVPLWFSDEFDGYFTRERDIVRVTTEPDRIDVTVHILSPNRREELIVALCDVCQFVRHG
jgi:hypothetical protein